MKRFAFIRHKNKSESVHILRNYLQRVPNYYFPTLIRFCLFILYIYIYQIFKTWLWPWCRYISKGLPMLWPIRQSGGAPCLWALDQPACDPPSAYKWPDDTDQWGPGPFCADLRLGSLHTRSVPHYHQNMSNPHNHHPYFTIHTPLLLLAFSYSPPPSRHPQVPRAEYGPQR